MRKSGSVTDPQEVLVRASRRDFIKLAGVGGVVLVSGFGLRSYAVKGAHVGRNSARPPRRQALKRLGTSTSFSSPTPTGDSKGRPSIPTQGYAREGVAAVNGLDEQPDFVVFTGDLTHTTDDDKARRERMARFQDIASGLKVKTVHYLAGEHDASLDQGEAFQKFFGKLHYTFDHKGVHFIVIDNVSDASAIVGDKQLAWLKADLAKLRKEQPIVVLTHRPLFDLAPDWDWATRDGQTVIDALMPYSNVTVFYGHIHQENHHMTGHIAHHSAKG